MHAVKTPSLICNNYEDYKIKVTLNPYLCDTTFKNILRGKEEGHRETKLANVNLQYKQRRPQSSFVFTGEANPKPESHIKKKFLPSNVMFNDSYIEKNPKIDKRRLINSPDRRQSVERRLRDNYGPNPMKIMSPQQQLEISQCYEQKNYLRTKAINGYLNSDKVKRTFRHMKRSSSDIETTNQSNSMINSSILDNSYLGHQKKHFKVGCSSSKDFFYL